MVLLNKCCFRVSLQNGAIAIGIFELFIITAGLTFADGNTKTDVLSVITLLCVALMTWGAYKVT